MAAGPVVPETVARASVTAAEKTPVIPDIVNRLEKLVMVPPAVAVQIIPRKLYRSVSLYSRAYDCSYYAFAVDPPVPAGTVTVNVSAVAKEPVDREESCCGAVLEPV